jgi:uncharacterized protein (DUF1330 family)
MPAYMIADIRMKNAAAYERYKTEVPALIRRHGGEYLVRGGTLEVLEGGWQPARLVIFRFPDRAAVHAFMNDPDYQPLKALRRECADSDIVAVDGL